jgi:TM2 domain-containing membrane protein YozV
MKQITFFRNERKGQIRGSLVEFDVYVDGVEYAVVRQGETKTIEVEDGSHRIQAKTRQGASRNFLASFSQSYQGDEVVGNTRTLKTDVILVGEDEENVHFLLTFNKTGDPLLVRAAAGAVPQPEIMQGGSQGVQAGVPQQAHYNQQFAATSEKSHMVAGILAILLGSLGIHKFYIGYPKAGIIMLVVTIVGGIPTAGIAAGIMAVIGIIEGVLYLTKSQQDFDNRYVYGKKSWF